MIQRQSAEFRARNEPIQLLPKFRARRAIHCLVLIIMAVGLLLIYHGFSTSLPRSDGSWDWFWPFFLFEFRHGTLGILVLVPMLYAAVALGWKRSIAVAVLLLVAATPYVLNFSCIASATVTSFAVILVPYILTVSLEMKLVADAKDRLAKEQEARRRADVMSALLRAQEDERRRIAMELHDTVIQTLLVTATTVHNLSEGKAMVDEEAQAELEGVKETTLHMIAEIRSICQGLRPSILDNLGLLAAIRWLVATMREETQLEIALLVEGEETELGRDETVVVFRVVQQALNNIQRHAQASAVSVTVLFTDDMITVDIEDDGRGFAVEEDCDRSLCSGKMGLVGMKERARAIGATLSVMSAEGAGTRVSISVGTPALRTVPALREDRSMAIAGLA